MEDLVVQNVSAVTHMIDEHEKGDTDSEIDCLPESFDITPLAASRNQRKLLCEGEERSGGGEEGHESCSNLLLLLSQREQGGGQRSVWEIWRGLG